MNTFIRRASVALLSLLLMACTNQVEPTETASKEENVTRYGWVIQVKADKLEEYKALHAKPWPEIDSMITACNIKNYSIYYRDGLLFSYLEYVGNDFEADMAKMAADSLTNVWWSLTDPCQEPVESAGEGVWWADLEEVYHLD